MPTDASSGAPPSVAASGHGVRQSAPERTRTLERRAAADDPQPPVALAHGGVAGAQLVAQRTFDAVERDSRLAVQVGGQQALGALDVDGQHRDRRALDEQPVDAPHDRGRPRLVTILHRG